MERMSQIHSSGWRRGFVKCPKCKTEMSYADIERKGKKVRYYWCFVCGHREYRDRK